MRLAKWVMVGLCAAALTQGAGAQSISPATMMGGANPSSIVNKPIDTSTAFSGVPGQAAQQNRFNLSSVFRKIPIPGVTPTKGVSPLPPPSAFPSTHYPNFRMVGRPPWPIINMFGNTTSPIQPMKPIVPDTRTPVGPGSK